ncbi:MAG: helix-turn-helix transcriptional regulator [Ruminococcaceae bacterium]|nr:helix-turn-helix transcriptional regulator [Oscillospiraceae bacterium]
MKLNIGETIKKLRKEREITQEEFAEILGVSCQSVSRWENNSCYPDIELIPTIASFFNISTDKLMGVDETAEKIAVEQYLNDFQEAISVGNIDACIRIARAGVAEFPNNYALLNKLMYALFLATSDDADIVNWEENKQKYDTEIVALGERIIKYCPDTNIRYEATERLAFHHSEMGRKTIGRSIYETLPSIYNCRESAIWWALSEEEKLPHTRKYISKAYHILYDSLYRLMDLISANDALKVIDKMEALDRLMYDDNIPNFTWRSSNMAQHRAKYYMKLNRYAEAIQQLSISVQAAIEFDNRPDELKIKSILLGEKTVNKIDFETADSRPLREILRDKWLAEKHFDPIRDTNEFKFIVEQLK